MKVSRRQWHFRVYSWTRKRLDNFSNRRNEMRRFDPSVDQVNLCPYMRTLLLYLPLLIVIHLGVFAWLIYTLIWLPAQWLPLLTIHPLWIILKFLGLVALCGATIGAVGAGGAWSVGKCIEQNKQHAGFCYLVAQYYKSIHDHFCPQIAVED